MTAEIRLQQASLEHMTKQPAGLRYALFCDSVLKGILNELCVSQNKGGHLGDFDNYPTAREEALSHPHAALVRFYPDYETRSPSRDFLADLRKKSQSPEK